MGGYAYVIKCQKNLMISCERTQISTALAHIIIAGLPPALCRRYPFIHLGDNVGQSILSKETTRWQGLGVDHRALVSACMSLTHK